MFSSLVPAFDRVCVRVSVVLNPAFLFGPSDPTVGLDLQYRSRSAEPMTVNFESRFAVGVRIIMLLVAYGFLTVLGSFLSFEFPEVFGLRDKER